MLTRGARWDKRCRRQGGWCTASPQRAPGGSRPIIFMRTETSSSDSCSSTASSASDMSSCSLCMSAGPSSTWAPAAVWSSTSATSACIVASGASSAARRDLASAAESTARSSMAATMSSPTVSISGAIFCATAGEDAGTPSALTRASLSETGTRSPAAPPVAVIGDTGVGGGALSAKGVFAGVPGVGAGEARASGVFAGVAAPAALSGVSPARALERVTRVFALWMSASVMFVRVFEVERP